MLRTDRSSPTRPDMLRWLEELLPGAAADGRAWRGHHLPLSTAQPLRPAHGVSCWPVTLPGSSTH